MRYSVACALDLQYFDDPRVGYRTARQAHAELRRLGKLDDAVRATRRRRTDELTVELSVTVDAATASEAFARCSSMLRSAVHATGGSTAGWDQLDLSVETEQSRRRGSHRRASGAQLTRPGTVTTIAEWTAATEAARRRGAPPASLPPLSWAPSTDAVVDLRAG
jgi:hypothetical protein